MSAIIVEHEALRFITGDVKDIGLKEYILKNISRDYHVTEFWANKDISFVLEKGTQCGL